jgi:hypothetical protein
MLDKCKYIVIDEAHDISEQMIFTLMIIKEFLLKYQNTKNGGASPQLLRSSQTHDSDTVTRYGGSTLCPVFIIMSATVDIVQFLEYYNVKPTYLDVGNVKRDTAADKFKIDIRYYDE